MYSIAPEIQTLPDVAEFIKQVNCLNEHPNQAVHNLFDPAISLTIARAPGRLDLMGGIADYSGSLVLQMPIQEATLVALQQVKEPVLRIVSLGDERQGDQASFTMPLADFFYNRQPTSYADAQLYFGRKPEKIWAAYIAGVFLVLMREHKAHFAQGAHILIQSSVPEGKGVSSSAAIEVAVMSAVAAAYGLTIPPRDMALHCQMVENFVVGAPCGVMDQMTAVLGEPHKLLALLCQPAEVQGIVSIPDALAVWGIDSGIRHAVSGADYSSVRVGAFMGYQILQTLSGTDWDGYLANLTPSEFEQFYARHLPEKLSGADFLEYYGKTHDTVTRIDPTRIYAVRQPTAHPIYEHFRVRTFARLLNGDVNTNAQQLGELMYQSHASYSACGLGSPGTDSLVQLARTTGATQGIYGAKITGGGSGGTVAILGRRDAEATIQWIIKQYAQSASYQPVIFRGSSVGAAAFGALHLQPTI